MTRLGIRQVKHPVLTALVDSLQLPERAEDLAELLGAVRAAADPVLVAPAAPFRLPDEEGSVKSLLAALDAVADRVGQCYPFTTGMGLAAPQIGHGRSIAIFRPPDDPQVVLINPRVMSTEPAAEAEWGEDWEGCLSFFDRRFRVPRPRAIAVAHQAPSGEWLETTFDRGRQARDVLHEIDHLAGTLCVERMRPGAPSTLAVR